VTQPQRQEDFGACPRHPKARVNLDTGPDARHLDRMPAQHGQTYDPQEEPASYVTLALSTCPEAGPCNIRGNPSLSHLTIRHSLRYAGAFDDILPPRPHAVGSC
jgi:hypothetical protein